MTRLSALFICLSIVTPATADIIFQDNFDDGNADGWTFIGTDNDEWGVSGGRLNSSLMNGDDRHDNLLGVAYINGITTPDHFRLEADVSVSHFQNPNGTTNTDRGHVGFAWGFDSSTFNPPTSDVVAHYLRTHWDQTTTFSYPSADENIFHLGTPVTNNVVYNMKVEVNYLDEVMEISFNDTLFDTISDVEFRNSVQHSGGNIGLANWGEEVTYDNVVVRDLTAASVPEPSSLYITGLFCIGVCFHRRRSQGAAA